MSASLPTALYVHFPWCVHKCPYCDFNSHPRKGDVPEDAYVDALLDDLDADIATFGERTVATMFFGGGTPSLFGPAAIARLMKGLRARIDLAQDIEITLEANPGAVDRLHFDGYLAAGVNRISIGGQSFSRRALAALGRIHGPEDTHSAIRAARAAGFARINLDLMHGLPGQTVADANDDIEAALAAGVDHISWYQLTIEAKTEFARRPPTLPGELTLADIEDDGLVRLHRAGFQRYEVSAFAGAGQQCRHNVNYWRFGDYLGIGAGAHGKITDPVSGRVVRTAKTAQPRRYLAVSDTSCATSRRLDTVVSSDALPGEFMLNALRLIDGVEFETFTDRTGLPFDVIESRVERLVAQGLLRDDRLAVTPTGLRFLDSVVAEFL